MKYCIISTLIFCLSMASTGQTRLKTDSLGIRLEHSTTDRERADIYLQLSELSASTNLEDALTYSKSGLSLSLSIGDEGLEAEFNLLLGSTYFKLGVYDTGIKHLLDALHFYESKQFVAGQFDALKSLGGVFDFLQDLDKSLDYYQRAYSLYSLQPDSIRKTNPEHIGILLNNIGSLYDKMGDKEKAIDYFHKGVAEMQGVANLYPLGSLYNNLGKMNMNIGQFDSSFYYIRKSIDIRNQINDQHGLSKSYFFLASHYRNLNQLDSARIAVNKCLSISEETGAWESIRISHWLLSQINEDENNHEAALQHFKIFKTFSDSILNKQKINHISRLQTNYEMEKYEKNAEMEKQAIRFRYTLLIIGLSVLVLLSIGLVIIYRVKKNRLKLVKENLELDVELKNKELTTNVMYMLRKNELINTVAKKLLILKGKAKTDNIPLIKGLIYDLQSEVDNEVWKEFELRFNQVYDDFYENLRQNHPDLSPAEERLCAFLKLKLNTKEIAAITHQSARGVDVARGRLRKKLNLTGTDTNLISYLGEF